MAWVKMKNKFGGICLIPEPVYNNMFKGQDAFSLVDDQPEPAPKSEEKIMEVASDDTIIRESRPSKTLGDRKSTKKAV